MLSVLALNVSAPTTARATAIAEYLWQRDEDVLVLSELGRGQGSRLLLQVCAAAGFSVVGGEPAPGGGPGQRSVAVVGRSIAVAAERIAPPRTMVERVVAVRVGHRADGVRLAGVYGAASDPVRYASSAQRARKRLWLGAFEAWVSQWRAADAGPGVLIGDLNLAPPNHDPALRYVLPEEVATYRRLTDPAGEAFVDAYARCHPDGTPQASAVSWVDHCGLGCRYDHALVTADLAERQLACTLDATPLQEGLSDHAALTVTLAPP